jgi:hypothetical protein
MPTQFFFKEAVNSKYCDILAKLNFDQFMEIYKQAEPSKHNIPTDELHVQYNMLIEYCNNMKFNNYSMQMEYGYANNKTDGRIFLKNTQGLQRLWSKFRGILVNDLMLDVDMVCAHNTILLYICKRHNIPALQLNNYVTNRELCLLSIMNDDKIERDEAKKLFLISINDCKPITKHGKYLIKSQLFKQYDAEMKTIQTRLCELYPVIYRKLNNSSDKTNIPGKLVNQLMCNIENEILLNTITLFNTNKYKVAVPMFDGCLIYKPDDETPDEHIITLLNENSREYGITWSIKEHNIDLATYIDTLQLTDIKHIFFGKNESELAHYINNVILKGKIYNCNGDIYLFNNSVWTNKNVKTILKPIINCHDLYTINNGKYYNHTKCNIALESLIKFTVDLCETKTNFNTLMYDSTMNKLCFENGYWDFKDTQFHEYNPDNMVYSTFIINRPYNATTSMYDEIYRRILYPMFNIIMDEVSVPLDTDENKFNMQYIRYILHSFARKIAGHIEDKEWMLLLGDRSSGKGILNALFEYAFEAYVTNAKGEEIICKQKFGEASKNAAWQNDFEFKRLIFIHEVPFELNSRGKPITFIDGNIIKQLSSGGDKLICRTNNRDERQFHIQASLIICCNDMPPIKPCDAMETVNTFNMPCSFLTNEQYELLSDKKKASIIWRPADKDLKHVFCRNLDVIDSFMNLILEAYTWKDAKKPRKIIEELKEEANEVSDYDRLMMLFEFHTKTCDNCKNSICYEHIVYNNDIGKLLEDNAIAFSLTKVNRLLLKAGCFKFITNSKRYIGGISIA